MLVDDRLFVSRHLVHIRQVVVGIWHAPMLAHSALSWQCLLRPIADISAVGRNGCDAFISAIQTTFAASQKLSARVVVATVRGDEHGDGRPAIGFDFVVVLYSRLIEACDNQKIGSFEKRGKQAGGPERIWHV